MRGMGAFQMAQMKHRDARVSQLCQHLRNAIDLLEQIASEPLVVQRDEPNAPAPKPVADHFELKAPANKITYTVKEAVTALGIGRTTLYAAMADGRLRSLKLGNRTLITSESLQAWIKSLPDR